MKKLLYTLTIAALAIGMAGCLDGAESHFTPRISYSKFYLNEKADSFGIKYSEELKGYQLADTIGIGDKIKFYVAFDALGNNLESANIKHDAAAMDMTFGPLGKIVSALLPESDTLAGNFLFAQGYQGVVIPVSYVTKKAGNHKLTFTVCSDSKFSPVTVELVSVVE